jgi:hypothetical protein
MERALAVWCASGIGWAGEKRAKGDLLALLETFRRLGVPDEFMTATGIAAQKTREPITLMVPLVWLAANRRSRPTMTKSELPATKVVDGVPIYALDKHTRLGREAIRLHRSNHSKYAVQHQGSRGNSPSSNKLHRRDSGLVQSSTITAQTRALTGALFFWQKEARRSEPVVFGAQT